LEIFKRILTWNLEFLGESWRILTWNLEFLGGSWRILGFFIRILAWSLEFLIRILQDLEDVNFR
jgi:hypothetical protein